MTHTKSCVAKLLLTTVVFLGLESLPAQAPAHMSADASNYRPDQLIPDHATLSVANLEDEIAWYERVMGFKVAEGGGMGDGFKVVHMAIPGYRFDLSWRKGSVRHRVLAVNLEQGWMHVAFKTPAIEADYNRLVAQRTDVQEYKNPDPTINRLIIHDPEGNEIEIQPADHVSAQTPADNPLQLAPNHATISVANIDKELAWYERVLGFKEGERRKMGGESEICHMTIPEYRIDLSWRNGSVRHAVLKFDMEQGWMHIVFKTTNIDAIYSQLVAQHAEVRVGRDKDSKITMAFVLDPEGNEIEFQPAN